MPSAPYTRSFVLLDIERFSGGHRNDVDRQFLRDALYDVFEQALEKTGIDLALVEREDRGDAIMALVFPSMSMATLLDEFADRLSVELAHRNGRASQNMRMRLRVAIHDGKVIRDRHGAVGDDLNFAFRLLNARELSRQLRGIDKADLALVVSEEVYRSVVRHGHGGIRPEEYASVEVKDEHKGVDAVAWVRYVSHGQGIAAPHRPRQEPSSPSRSPSSDAALGSGPSGQTSHIAGGVRGNTFFGNPQISRDVIYGRDQADD